MRVIPPDLVARYEREGWWTADTIADLLTRGLAAAPDTEFRVHSAARPWTGTFGDVELVARRLAGGLRARGVSAGDTVAFQLPNWMEAAAAFWAASLLGAVVVPIVHIYGPREVRHILGSVRPQAFLTTDRFGSRTYDPEVYAEVPVVGVVGGSDPDTAFEALLADEPWRERAAVDPAGPVLIAFTSGTTSAPKGVVHSHRTLLFETRQMTARRPADLTPQLITAPVGHFIGMLSAFLVPVLEGSTIDMVDTWNPAQVLDLMTTYGIAVGGGVPYYMTSLIDHPNFTPEHLALIKYAGLGGAPVPVAVVERLTALGIEVARSYGSTEHPSMTVSEYTDSRDKRIYTDGCPAHGVEVRVTEDGEILSRGPDLCLGYTDDALTTARFDAEGWYHTGDIAALDADGYLTITDRTTDLIIRGGENISALEVEDVLITMSGVAEAAAVAAPDTRMGEHVAAILRLTEGASAPTLEDLRAHFAHAGLAKQKWPEEMHIVTEFPRTASGKVQKFLLRRNLHSA
ncbi:AMP-binding protein [Nocardia macrotermitis]|uniref:Medium-chain fatty-acid--CoA ligase n=1 Tax=Nocardia macrotermitis TaxID=2585198 RepID=A0A7K0DEP0_9NOCA|nr:AMP-binding protein [Nocardia macrotermitis]MQY24138.1 Medium-chain fatty-acid--CoA ligase [Nocardia macrotermitis]